MKNPMLLAAAFLAGGQALAAAPALPESCKQIASQSTQILDQRVEEGDDSHADITLKSDPAHLPVTKVSFLGNCDENGDRLKKSWCRVAGGSPDVYQVKVSDKSDDGYVGAKATVIVTFNRGYCRVDEIISE